MFDKEFFKKRQKVLLWLLNKPFIRVWFRWVMCIDYKERILQITPNSYTFDGRIIFVKGKPTAELKTDFRTHNKYSKRLFYAFKPFWWVLHTWDTLIANNFCKRLNLGFDSTFYPDAGIGNDTVDGHCRHWTGSPITWADLIAGVGYDANGTIDTMAMQMTASAANDWVSLVRMLFTFDTSDIGSGTITAATLSLYGSSKVDYLSATPDIGIYASAPADNNALVGGDYDSLGSTAFSTAITYANWATDGYNDFSLNANGRTNINKTGVSTFGARNVNYDVGATEPPWASSQVSQLVAIAADITGTTSDPKLVVTWSVPITPTNADITLTGNVPVIVATIAVSPANGTITLTTQVPVVAKTGGFSYLKAKTSTDWTFKDKS